MNYADLSYQFRNAMFEVACAKWPWWRDDAYMLEKQMLYEAGFLP
jgi:hypothetical protein